LKRHKKDMKITCIITRHNSFCIVFLVVLHLIGDEKETINQGTKYGRQVEDNALGLGKEKLLPSASHRLYSYEENNLYSNFAQFKFYCVV
jgi:hypothetical protein